MNLPSRSTVLFSLGVLACVILLAYVFSLDQYKKARAHRHLRSVFAPPAAPAEPAPDNSEEEGENADAEDEEGDARQKESKQNAGKDGKKEDLDEEGADYLSREQKEKLPAWALEFAKMRKDRRVLFAATFADAKKKYAIQHYAECLSRLNECDIIFSNNPNVWNLRGCALLEMELHSDAEPWVRKVLEIEPDNLVARMSLAEILMQRDAFEECIPVLVKLRKSLDSQQKPAMRDVFTFRQILCHLMLRQEMEAKAIITSLTPMHDTPLYYLAQASMAIYKDDGTAAANFLNIATRIFSKDKTLLTYKKSLERCGLRDKFQKHRPVEQATDLE